MSSRREGAAPLGAAPALLTVLVLGLVVAGAGAALFLRAGDRAPRHAAVEGVPIGGLGPAAAAQRLRAALTPRAGAPVEVSYGDGRTASVAPADAGLSVDWAASVRAAGAERRLGLPRLWALVTGGGGHRAVLHVDRALMQAALGDLDAGLAQPPVEPALAFRDGRAVVVPGRAGLALSRSRAETLLARRYLRAGSEKLPVDVVRPEVGPAEVRRALLEFARPAMSGPVVLVLAGRRVVVPPRLLGEALSTRAVGARLVPQVDPDRLLDALMPLLPGWGREAVDARVLLRGGVPVVAPARTGLAVDPDALARSVLGAVLAHGAARRAVVPGRLAAPALSTAQARALGVRRRVSASTTTFPYADYRNRNLARAARLVDGTLLRPGETFSFNGVVGERSAANGFTEGYVASDGVVGRDAGGGTAPLATALFDAAWRAGLRDVEHVAATSHTPGLPWGREVTVFSPGGDLRFADDTRHGVLVSARVRAATPGRRGSVTVALWSTPSWRVSSVVGRRSNVVPAQVRWVPGPGCRPRRGAAGFAVEVRRTLRAPGSGRVVRRETLHSVYPPGQIVRCGAPPSG